jgi:hypothetical protein
MGGAAYYYSVYAHVLPYVMVVATLRESVSAIIS